MTLILNTTQEAFGDVTSIKVLESTVFEYIISGGLIVTNNVIANPTKSVKAGAEIIFSDLAQIEAAVNTGERIQFRIKLLRGSIQINGNVQIAEERPDFPKDPIKTL